MGSEWVQTIAHSVTNGANFVMMKDFPTMLTKSCIFLLKGSANERMLLESYFCSPRLDFSTFIVFGLTRNVCVGSFLIAISRPLLVLYSIVRYRCNFAVDVHKNLVHLGLGCL